MLRKKCFFRPCYPLTHQPHRIFHLRVLHINLTQLWRLDIHASKTIDATFRPHYPLTHQPTRVTHQFHTTLKGLDIDVRHLSHKTINTTFCPHDPLTHQPHRIFHLRMLHINVTQLWRGWTSMLDTCRTKPLTQLFARTILWHINLT